MKRRGILSSLQAVGEEVGARNTRADGLAADPTILHACRGHRNKPDGSGVRLSVRASTCPELVILFFLVFGAFSIAQETFFPKKALSDDSWSDRFRAKWYSQELEVLEEPSVLALAKHRSESYRFLWLRSFHHPVAIRFDIRGDGIGVLTTKVASGAGGFCPGHLIENVSRPLTRAQTQAFLARLERVGFWSLPGPVNDRTGTDGSEWIMEGVKEGKYHVVARWSPDEGAVRELGLYLAIGLAQMNVPKDEIY